MAVGRRCGCDTGTVVTKSELSFTLIGIVKDASLAQGVFDTCPAVEVALSSENRFYFADMPCSFLSAAGFSHAR